MRGEKKEAIEVKDRGVGEEVDGEIPRAGINQQFRRACITFGNCNIQWC